MKEEMTEGQVGLVRNLFERATSDFLSVDVWLCWTEWEESLAEDNQYEGMRQRFEQAITQAGLHVARGQEIWNAYISLERRILEIVTGDKTAQQEKVRRLYQRSLSLPLFNIEQRMNEYLEWEKSLGANSKPCSFMDQYNQAKTALEERMPFELLISDSDPNNPNYEQINNWWEYIRFEEQHNEIFRVRCLYERALKNYFLVYDMWFSYISYLLRNVKNTPKLILGATGRAYRNYPYTHHLWCIHLNEMERFKKPIAEIEQVFEDALLSGFSSEEDYYQMYSKMIDIKIRRFRDNDKKEENELRMMELRAFCNRATDYFGQYFPNSPFLVDLTRIWALVEGEVIKDEKNTVELFESLVKNYSKRADLWLDAVKTFKLFGNYELCRNYLKRGANICNDILILNEWNIFESLHGSSEDQALAAERIATRKAEIAEAAAKEALIIAKKEAKAKRTSRKDPKEEKMLGSASKKRKIRDEKIVEREPKRAKTETKKTGPQMDKKVIHVSNLPDNANNEELKKLFESFGSIVETRCIYDTKGKFKGFAFIEFEKESSASDAVNAAAPEKETGIHYNDARVKVSFSRALKPGTVIPQQTISPPPPKQQAYDDKLTMFVKNLAYITTEEELQKALTESDPTISIKEVRLVRDRNSGRSKGFAYVQFNDNESLQKALTLDGKTLHNFAMQLAISKPPTKPAPPKNSDKVPTSTEKDDHKEQISKMEVVQKEPEEKEKQHKEKDEKDEKEEKAANINKLLSSILSKEGKSKPKGLTPRSILTKKK
eukprot:TRINITY_DN22958_c0_g1_i1.p1 TRINITY_DN22958_c0_g1~~TRINITY_DN22958_c0_g1_i1.p1  ORF type:complete len:891 (-),score=251.39 TRINITY_DN22958_c0_g1_i1:22-2346(-)